MTVTMQVIIIYFVVVFLIGIIAYFRTKNHEDYILGGRSFSAPVIALGVGASDMSGWLLMGLPGAVFLLGISQAWMAIGLTIGSYLNWCFVGRRLRIFSEIHDALTVPDFWGKRFGDDNKVIQLVTACIICFFFTIYTASGFVAGGQLFISIFPFLTYHQGIIVAVLSVGLYTMIGGFLAVNWIDFLQGLLMFFALLIVPIGVCIHIGGIHTVLNDLSGSHFNLLRNTSTIMIVSLLGWGLGYFGQPHILVRFKAIRNPDSLITARRIYMTWNILVLFGAVSVGLVGAAYYHQYLAKPETVFLKLSVDLFTPWVSGILLAAVCSAIMSTLAGQMLVSSSAVIEDVYHARIRVHAHTKELIWAGRLVIGIVMLLGWIIAWNPRNSILSLVAHAWAGLGASFGSVMLAALFWDRATSRGAILGMSFSAITVVVWWIVLRPMFHGIFDLYEIIPGFIAGIIGIIFGSLTGKPPTEEMLQTFQQFKNSLNN